MGAATIRFLRIRNGEGCDVFIQPYAGNQNAGYILVDLDRAGPDGRREVCAPTGMTLVWCCKPALAICRPGFVSGALFRWNRTVRPPPASTWRACTGGDLASTDWRHRDGSPGFTITFSPNHKIIR